MDPSSASQTGLSASTNNVLSAGRSQQNPGERDTLVASRLLSIHNTALPPANLPSYASHRQDRQEVQNTGLSDSLSANPPPYFIAPPGYSALPRATETIVELEPIGHVQRTEISPALSGKHLQQAQKHVARIEEKIEKFYRFVRYAREGGGQVTRSMVAFSSAHDAMVTLRNAWANGSLQGSSRIGMMLRRTEADQQRKEGEQVVTVAIKQLLILADADLQATPGQDMARVMNAAEDLYVMPI